MKRHIFISLVVGLVFSISAVGQVPLNIGVQILKAEDSRDWNAGVEALLKSPNAAVRERAAMAAGRIGREEALPLLHSLLKTDESVRVRAMAAFAIGEIESIRNAYGLIGPLATEKEPSVRARIIEAAGKMAAANPVNAITPALKRAIVEVMQAQASGSEPLDPQTVLLGLTAVVRAKPDKADELLAKFIDINDAKIRTEALGAMARLRAKVDAKKLTDLISSENDDAVRVNAMRAAAAGDVRDLKDLLIKAATTNSNAQIRVAAIRVLAGLKDSPDAVVALLKRGNEMLIPIHGDPAPLKPGQKATNLKPIEVPLPKNELLEIATTIGRIRAGSDDKDALAFLNKLAERDDLSSPETFVAIARVSPKAMLEFGLPKSALTDFRVAAAYGQGLGELSSLKSEQMNADAGQRLLGLFMSMLKDVTPKNEAQMMKALPDLLRALASLKPDNLDTILRNQIAGDDVFVRAAAADLLSDRPYSKENFDAIQKAFSVSMVKDKSDNDAMLTILDALAKLDKKAAVGSLLMALNSRDYLVRKKAFELLEDKEIEKTSPGVPFMLKQSRQQGLDKVQKYVPVFGTKLGQVLNTDLDYRRALSRKNGSVKAVLTTEKGAFTIVFAPEQAPLTVDNWVKLARAGYFNGLAVHRVVPNFVMQDGDPRGDGNGGPGWSIRCEVNMLPYERGAVGMALSGKDTGGSQWFVTHSPQPHLDGGYTVFGHVNDKDMMVVDKIARGDKILKVTIVGR